jgi:hypothetical protein
VKFINALFWEFVQNLPILVLFVAAVWFWAQRSKAKAMTCIAAGAVAAALVIRFTEPLTSGYWEPVSVTIVNVVSMSVLQFLVAAYLGTEARWSNQKMDLVVGGLTGVSLAIAQGVASQGSPLIGIILHSVALGVACALILVAIRMLKGKSLASALANSILIVVVMTLLIGVIDYGYFLILG